MLRFDLHWRSGPFKLKSLFFRLDEISGAASKEFGLEKAMEKMKVEWKDMYFEFIPYRDTVSVGQYARTFGIWMWWPLIIMKFYCVSRERGLQPNARAYRRLFYFQNIPLSILKIFAWVDFDVLREKLSSQFKIDWNSAHPHRRGERLNSKAPRWEVKQQGKHLESNLSFV